MKNLSVLNKKTVLIRFLKILMFIFVCWAMIHICNYLDHRDFREDWVEVLEGGWTVTREDNNIVMENILPEDIKSGMYLLLISHMQEVDVYIDNMQIYHYPDENFPGGVVPNHWNFVKVPDDSAGNDVCIVLQSPNSHFQYYPKLIYYGYYGNLISYIQHCQISTFLISLSIGVIGIIILLGALLSVKYGQFIQQEILGIIFVLAAVCSCSESGFLLSWIREDILYYAVFISLNICPILIIVYCYLRSRKLCCRIRLYVIFYCAVTGLSLVLYVLGCVDFSQTLMMVNVLLLISLLCLIRTIWEDIKSGKNRYVKSELFFAGIVLVAFCYEAIGLYTGSRGRPEFFMQISLFLYAVNKMVAVQRYMFDTIVEKAQLEKSLQLSRIELMTSQIKPHFIYNVMNSIQILIKLDPGEAGRMVHYFSQYLRGNLSLGSEQRLVEFSKELHHVQAYVEIEKVRFEDKLNVEYDIEELNFLIPPLSVQPLVENAIKHGICQTISGGTVRIRSRQCTGGYMIEVIDDGPGFDISILQQNNTESYGIDNIRFRIEEICHGKLKIESSAGAGTKASIFIPDISGKRVSDKGRLM